MPVINCTHLWPPVPIPVAEADRAEAHSASRAHGPGITDASAAVVPSTALVCSSPPQASASLHPSLLY